MGFGNPPEIAALAETIGREDEAARLRAFLENLEARERQRRLEEKSWELAVDKRNLEVATARCDRDFVLAGLSELFRQAAPETLIRGQYTDKFGRTVGLVARLGATAYGSLLLQEAGDAINASGHVFSEATERPLQITDLQADINGPLPDAEELTLGYAVQVIGDALPRKGSWLNVALDLAKITPMSSDDFKANRVRFLAGGEASS